MPPPAAHTASDSEEDLLGDVLCKVGTADDAPSDPEHVVLVALEQNRESLEPDL